MTDFTKEIQKYLDTECTMLQSLNIGQINEAVNAIVQARDRGAVIYTMGNGGSAATASHLVCDFAKGTWEAVGGKKFLFECLSDNTPIVTAIANDISYEDVFVFQLRDKLKPDDLIIAISGSGNSRNVLKAVDYAKKVGTKVIGVTGYQGGKLKAMSDYYLHVAIDDMQIAEDIHMMFDHMIMRVIDRHYNNG
jgi:D-sedoheptulose 7-phosphate isomerase